MKQMKMQIVTVGAASVVLAFAAGCGQQSESLERKQSMAKEEAAEAMDAGGEYADAAKDEMVQDLQRLSGDLMTKLDSLKDKSGEEAAEMRTELQKQKKKVDAALADIADASAEQWEDMKQGTANVAQDVSNWLNKQTD